jgi:hypothetical protein
MNMAKAASAEEAQMLMAIYAGQKLPALAGVLERLQALGLVQAGPRGFILTTDGVKAARLATAAAAQAEGAVAPAKGVAGLQEAATFSGQPR